MNERINELRLDAGISRLHDEPKFMVAVSEEGTVIEPLDGLQKFAELIVRECIDVISPYAIRMENFDGGHPITDLKKHFGVE